MEGRGLAEIWKIIQEYASVTRDNGYFNRNRSRQARYWMYEFINESLRSDFYARPGIDEKLKLLENEVLKGSKSSYHAALEILDLYRSGR
jgi:LAO/AO transport system kinase